MDYLIFIIGAMLAILGFDEYYNRVGSDLVFGGRRPKTGPKVLITIGMLIMIGMIIWWIYG